MSSKAQEFVSTTAARSEPVRILIADDQADVRTRRTIVAIGRRHELRGRNQTVQANGETPSHR